jgi:hypothetical protein
LFAEICCKSSASALIVNAFGRIGRIAEESTLWNIDPGLIIVLDSRAINSNRSNGAIMQVEIL